MDNRKVFVGFLISQTSDLGKDRLEKWQISLIMTEKRAELVKLDKQKGIR
jgi:hypothetical protein